MGQGLFKRSGATGYAQGGERCYGSLDNGVQNLLPGDFLELFIGIFVLKDLFFLSFRTKTRNLWA